MLNKNQERELCYLAKVTDIKPMDAERLEAIYINGWVCVAGKGEFKIGDLGVFFEPDSQLPEVEPFVNIEFLKSKHYKIKPQKIRGVVSQGLFMPVSAFGWIIDDADGSVIIPPEKQMGKSEVLTDEEETRFLTQRLGVTYAVVEDNQRKAPSIDKYKKMAQRRPEIFKHKWAQWFMRRNWGKKLMFFFFGKKKDKKGGWKWDWVSKSDQERCQNMPWVFADKESTYTETTKIDGTSSTFVLEKIGKFGNKWEFSVCSRNVVFENENQENYHSKDENVYWEVANKWHIREFLEQYAKKHNVTGVALQGETAGCSLNGVKLQGDPHQFGELRFFGFDLYVNGIGKTDILEARDECAKFGIDWVPVVNTEFVVPDNCDELLEHATGDCEAIGAHGLREGYVYRKNGDAKFSFKAVSPEYLISKK